MRGTQNQVKYNRYGGVIRNKGYIHRLGLIKAVRSRLKGSKLYVKYWDMLVVANTVDRDIRIKKKTNSRFNGISLPVSRRCRIKGKEKIKCYFSE